MTLFPKLRDKNGGEGADEPEMKNEGRTCKGEREKDRLIV